MHNHSTVCAQSVHESCTITVPYVRSRCSVGAQSLNSLYHVGRHCSRYAVSVQSVHSHEAVVRAHSVHGHGTVRVQSACSHYEVRKVHGWLGTCVLYNMVDRVRVDGDAFEPCELHLDLRTCLRGRLAVQVHACARARARAYPSPLWHYRSEGCIGAWCASSCRAPHQSILYLFTDLPIDA